MRQSAAFASRCLNRRMEGEDVVQGSVLEAYRNPDGSKTAAPQALAFQITHNGCIDFLRHAVRCCSRDCLCCPGSSQSCRSERIVDYAHCPWFFPAFSVTVGNACEKRASCE